MKNTKPHQMKPIYLMQKSYRFISPHFSHYARLHFVAAYFVPLHSAYFSETHFLLQRGVSQPLNLYSQSSHRYPGSLTLSFRLNAHKTLHSKLHRDLSFGQSGVGRPLFLLRKLRYGRRTADGCPAIATFRKLHTCDDRTFHFSL